MTPEEWKELYDLSMIQVILPDQEERYRVLLEKTEKVDEHPEDYEGPCFCQLCMSYGD